MIFIILILLSNIYITKINNNYTSSGLIEGFSIGGSKNDSKVKEVNTLIMNHDNALHTDYIVSAMCNNDFKKEIIDYAQAYKEDIPKILGFNVYYLMLLFEKYVNNQTPKVDKDKALKSIVSVKEVIDTLNVINKNLHHLETECGGGLFSGGGNNNNKSSNTKSSSGGMFGGMFSNGGSNNNKSSGGGWFGGDDSDK